MCELTGNSSGCSSGDIFLEKPLFSAHSHHSLFENYILAMQWNTKLDIFSASEEL